MAKEVEVPKEEKAPAYFAQYSALWCILLGFFVMLLSLGQSQRGPGAAGIGEVRDAFGSKGGVGLLPFAKNALFGKPNTGASSFRIIRSAPGKRHKVEGYIRGMLWKKGLSSISMVTVNESPSGMQIILSLPITFRAGGHLDQDSVHLLELFGELVFSLNGYVFDIMSVCESEDPDLQDQKDALLESAVVSRFLLETSSLSPKRVHAVAYADKRFLSRYGIENVKGKVLVSIYRDNP